MKKLISISLVTLLFISSIYADGTKRVQSRELYKKHRKEKFELRKRLQKDRSEFLKSGVSTYDQKYFDFNESQITLRENLEDKHIQEKCDVLGGRVYCDSNGLKQGRMPASR